MRKNATRPPTISVIMPTCGRDTLGRALASLDTAGAGIDDEVIVVGDGPQPEARALVKQLKLPCRALFWETDTTNDKGATQRNHAQTVAEGDFLCYLDDDDVMLPGAFDAMRRGAIEEPGIPLLFKMLAYWGAVLPLSHTVTYGHVSGSMLVTPNIAGKVGEWGGDVDRHDYEMIRATIKLYDGRFAWRPEILVSCRPALP